MYLQPWTSDKFCWPWNTRDEGREMESNWVHGRQRVRKINTESNIIQEDYSLKDASVPSLPKKMQNRGGEWERQTELEKSEEKRTVVLTV